jgi:hypothetical protein
LRPDQAGAAAIGRAVGRASMSSNEREVPALFGIVFYCYHRQGCEHPARVFPAFGGDFTRSHAFRALFVH